MRRYTIHHSRSLLSATALVSALTASVPAIALDGVASGEAETFTIEEITVTAVFRETKLQETPIAITALSGDMMESRSMVSVVDVAAFSPNVTLQAAPSNFGKSVPAFIRGVGELDYNFALEPGVGFYVDDIYHGTLFGSTFDLLDLERVEVLRGPQGTLFGKNNIGGAIRLISKLPQGDNSGSIEATYGSYDRLDVRGGFDVSLIDDKLFVRVSGVSKERDGHVTRLDFTCDMIAKGTPALAGSIPAAITNTTGDCKLGTTGGENIRAGRVAARLLASPDIEINVSADYMDDNSEAAAETLLLVNPAWPPLAGWNAGVVMPTYGITYNSRFIPADPYTTYATYRNPISGLSGPIKNGVESWGVHGTLDWKLTDKIQLKSITAYRAYTGEFTDDGDQSPLGMTHQPVRLGHEQLSEEIRLLGTAFGDAFEWTIGGFYFDSKNHLEGTVDLALIGFTFDTNDESNVQDIAAYVHGVWHVTDRLNVTGGMRYTDEKKDYTFFRFFLGGFTPPFEVSYTRWNPKVAIDYRWTDEIMTYAQFSTGFRAGGINPRPSNVGQVVGFGPEDLRSYEIGIKSDLFNRRMRLNLAAFYSEYTDMQMTAIGLDNAGVLAAIPQNVGTAHIKGIEAELEARPIEPLMISATFGYTDFQLKDLGTAAGVAGGPTLASQPRGVSKVNAALGVQYDIGLGNSGTLSPRLDVTYRSKFYNLWTNTAASMEPAHTLLNGRITWRSPDDDWSVALSVTNLTDKLYYINKFDLMNTWGVSEGNPARPREWAVTAKRNF